MKMNFCNLNFGYFLLLSGFPFTISNIELFVEQEFRGESTIIERDEFTFNCTNLPNDFTWRISSVKFSLTISWRDDCVALYSSFNCEGRSIEILYDRSPFLNILYKWNFDKTTASIGKCKSRCDKSVTGAPPNPEEYLNVELFHLQEYKGHSIKLNVRGCTRIPREYVGLVRGIKTNGTCFELHDTPDCIKTLMQHQSLEIRPYFPAQYDLYIWGHWSYYDARAISHCYYKCNREKYFVPQEGPDLKKITKNMITAYDYENYLGNWINIDAGKCTNFSIPWVNNVHSVKAYGKCVSLFRRFACEGSAVTLNSTVEKESESLRFKLEDIKSARLCVEEKADNLKPYKEDSPLILYLWIGLGLVTLKIIVASIVIVSFVKADRKGRRIELSDREIQDFIKGVHEEEKNTGVNRHEIVTGHDILYYGLRDAGMGLSKTGINHRDNYVAIQNSPLESSIIVSKKDFSFETKDVIGKGEFGIVYKGHFKSKSRSRSNQTETALAVKAISRTSNNADHLRSLMKEVKLLMFVGNHQRLVKLVGCCIENLKHGQLYLLLEYCEKGSLEKFLHAHKSSFVNVVDKGKLLYPVPLQNAATADDFKFDYFRLLQWCKEIAEGMEYLSTKHIVHADLSIRNILLDKNLNVKISDFGLSRKLQNYSAEYKIKKSDKIPLPWRWLPIETLQNMEFTLKSDVWMYGVTCWEIFTLGERPYSGMMGWGQDFIQNLIDGMRLRKPKYSTSECYNVMLSCWEEDPTKRPTFSQILQELNEIRFECN